MVQLTSILRKLGYLAAMLIILSAVLAVAMRLATPVLNNYRPQFEKMGSELLGSPLTIQEVKASWYGYQPDISLKNVTLYDKSQQKPLLQVQEVRLFFSIVKSLWERKPILNTIMLSDSNLRIAQKPSGEISVQGLLLFNQVNEKALSKEEVLTKVMNWQVGQPNFILNNIQLYYTDAKQKNYILTVKHLKLQNDGLRHTIHGEAILKQTTPTQVSFNTEWIGQQFDPINTQAKIYLYATGVSLSQ